VIQIQTVNRCRANSGQFAPKLAAAAADLAQDDYSGASLASNHTDNKRDSSRGTEPNRMIHARRPGKEVLISVTV